LLHILNIKNRPLRHAITSMISILASTIRGIEYITYNGNDAVLQRVIRILDEQDNGSVTQRFCLAILQKCSVKESLMGTYLDNDLIVWVLKLIKISFAVKVHMFCLDFATAMLANMLHSKWGQISLVAKPEQTVYVMDCILKYIREPVELSVLMHLLISLSYLCKPKFKKQAEAANVSKRVSEFAEYYEGSCSKGK
jgi:hypothetical protein